MTHALSKKSQSLPMIAKFRRGGVRLGISHRTILNRKRKATGSTRVENFSE